MPVAPAPEGFDYAQRLLELGFWHDGSYTTLGQAVMAFEKYHGIANPSYEPDQAALDLMAVDPIKPHGLADVGDVVEIDKSRQLIFVVKGGKTQWIFNTSTGSEVPYTYTDNNTGEPGRGDAVTHNGIHSLYRQVEGWRNGSLGRLWRPKYFYGGEAIHGYNNVPNYPASHGCSRVSMSAIDFIWENDIMPTGITAWVHGQNP